MPVVSMGRFRLSCAQAKHPDHFLVSQMGLSKLSQAFRGHAEGLALFVTMSDPDTVKITKAFIHKGKTLNGGWTAAQLKLVGIDWPPESGWIYRIEGNSISTQDAQSFLKIGMDTHRTESIQS